MATRVFCPTFQALQIKGKPVQLYRGGKFTVLKKLRKRLRNDAKKWV